MLRSSHPGSSSPSGKLLIADGNVVLEDRMIQASIAVENGRIAAIIEEKDKERWIEHWNGSAAFLQAAGKYVLPGLIDIHCDAIEKEVQPRPNTLFPLDMAFLEFERKLPVHGITTMYHSLSLGVGLSLRGDHLLTEMVELIHRYSKQRSMIRNRVHLRYEVTHQHGLPIVKQFIEEDKIHYLSFMNHSPGQGQYRKPGSFESYVMKNQGVSMEEVQQIVHDLLLKQQSVDWEELRKISRLALDKGISIASHDDDTMEKIDENRSYGVSVSEFPITLEVATYGMEQGMSVCVGAPNVVRGGSHDHNLSASEAIRSGAAAILCSDYHPSSMLAALFKLADEAIIDLPGAVRMATLHPARALGVGDQLGSIEEGKLADLIVVDRFQGMPWVTDAIVGGVHVYAADVRY
ncbi:alpha-D-ribose 1-methylphosphonate 5-triphosphate diphosphatase [Paenibacillus sp. 1011MAR3C5]|uniref:alpha-D-ribose 1-methylphosphonate 5-triphosphate diphosphatase n=1 Tax=Paenibacillus sp. 1011MAR3C5 TaxID=1675787 RepID=UPI000E6B729B|nr:alpha-D-ribose 1-methylphosphonate 5-triphosphate diphosphatase [Paenibacillus sp. 1011MAR3C5]RJE91314.1 alpha-D-ribose 1-methylphosphonate 5-triphosphate diphosphatase [Paenibacillus sp. 1011MAR3C5]